jgi:release factor glutamine methyltransferase
MSAPAMEMTAASLLAGTTRRLRAAGIETAALDARLIVQAALGIDAGALLRGHDRPVTAEEAARIGALAARRAVHEPVAYLTGRREFWGLEFHVAPGVLIPRPDSETLVEAALDLCPDKEAPLRVIDLGAGSGALLLAVLSERPRARGLAIDRSAAAIIQTLENAARLGMADRVQAVQGDWLAGIAQTFDLVLANPPYVRSDEMAGLPADVRDYEPHGALDGGADGLEPLRAIMARLPAVMAPEGVALFECAPGQADEAAALGRDAGLTVVRVLRDLAGRRRGVALRRP